MNDNETEISDQEEKSKKDPFFLCGVILLVILIVLILCGGISSTIASERYEKSMALISSGDYKQASELLEKIKKKNYKDAEGLFLLCEAHLEYEERLIWLAQNKLKEARRWYQTHIYFDPPEDINSFMTFLEKDESAARAAAAERERQVLEYKIKNGVPFEGMPESRIGDTILGKPSDNVEKRRRWQYINSNLRVEYYEYVYSFYNKNGYLVFEAVCVGGNVRRVNDYRKNPVAPFDPSKYRGKIYDNSPSVDGFSNPEDFYDWYYDDFFDYEEAEDYYYSHGGR